MMLHVNSGFLCHLHKSESLTLIRREREHRPRQICYRHSLDFYFYIPRKNITLFSIYHATARIYVTIVFFFIRLPNFNATPDTLIC